MGKLTKPPGIENDAFKSLKWDELTSGREFDLATVKLSVTRREVSMGGRGAYSHSANSANNRVGGVVFHLK